MDAHPSIFQQSDTFLANRPWNALFLILAHAHRENKNTLKEAALLKCEGSPEPTQPNVSSSTISQIKQTVPSHTHIHTLATHSAPLTSATKPSDSRHYGSEWHTSEAYYVGGRWLNLGAVCVYVCVRVFYAKPSKAWSQLQSEPFIFIQRMCLIQPCKRKK